MLRLRLMIQMRWILMRSLCLCVRSLDRALVDLKGRRSALMASLRNPTVEVDRPQQAGESEKNTQNKAHHTKHNAP